MNRCSDSGGCPSCVSSKRPSSSPRRTSTAWAGPAPRRREGSRDCLLPRAVGDPRLGRSSPRRPVRRPIPPKARRRSRPMEAPRGRHRPQRARRRSGTGRLAGVARRAAAERDRRSRPGPAPRRPQPPHPGHDATTCRQLPDRSGQKTARHPGIRAERHVLVAQLSVFGAVVQLAFCYGPVCSFNRGRQKDELFNSIGRCGFGSGDGVAAVGLRRRFREGLPPAWDAR